MNSVFRSYSVAVVAENKAPGVRFVNCTPMETMPALNGEVTFNPSAQTLRGTDIEGNAYEVNATMDSTITAEWLPSGSNRVTPPDVQRGELVELFRLADSDQLYWRCMGLRDNLRRLETVVYAFNASPEGNPQEGVNFKTCYFIEISTHNGSLTVGTSKANGEPFAYTFQINAKEGAVNLLDDAGQQFEFDSVDRRLLMINADQTYIRVEKKTVDIKADDQIQLTCGGNVFKMLPNETHWTSKLVRVITDLFKID